MGAIPPSSHPTIVGNKRGLEATQIPQQGQAEGMRVPTEWRACGCSDSWQDRGPESRQHVPGLTSAPCVCVRVHYPCARVCPPVCSHVCVHPHIYTHVSICVHPCRDQGTRGLCLQDQVSWGPSRHRVRPEPTVSSTGSNMPLHGSV